MHKSSEREIMPPLVIILRATETVKCNLSEIEAQLSEKVAGASQESNTSTAAERKALLKESHKVRALLRNLNLLILDIFKEFDQVVAKILATNNSSKDEVKVATKLTISREALLSLTQLLSL